MSKTFYVRVNNPNTEWVWSWSFLYPVYSERMAAMAEPKAVANAYEAAAYLKLK